MIAGECPDPVGAQELVLVEHAGQNPAQPFRIDQGGNSALPHAEMARTGRMNADRSSSGIRFNRS